MTSFGRGKVPRREKPKRYRSLYRSQKTQVALLIADRTLENASLAIKTESSTSQVSPFPPYSSGYPTYKRERSCESVSCAICPQCSIGSPGSTFDVSITALPSVMFSFASSIMLLDGLSIACVMRGLLPGAVDGGTVAVVGVSTL